MSLYSTLFPFQKNIVDKFKDKERYGLFLDMGLGKTLVSLAFAEVNNCTKVIVVTINSKATEDITVDGSWKNWASKSDIKYNIYDKHIFKPTKKYPNRFTESTNDFLILNYESLFKRNLDHGVALKPELNDFLKSCKGHNVAIILDESHKVKETSSTQNKAVNLMVKMSKMYSNKTYLYLGTGTPFTRNFLDLFAQLKLLGWSGTKTDFLDKFCVRGNIGGLLGWQQPVVGFKNIELLYKLIHCFAITIKSEEVRELPEKVFIKHCIPTSLEFNLLTLEKAKMLDVQKVLKERNLPYFMSENAYDEMSFKEKEQYWKSINTVNEDGNWKIGEDYYLGSINDSYPSLMENLALIYNCIDKIEGYNWLWDYYYLFDEEEGKDENGKPIYVYKPKKFKPKKLTINPFYRNYAYPEKHWFAETKGVAWMRARQMSIGFQGNDSKYTWYNEDRIKALKEFLEENEDNYLIFTNFVPEFIAVVKLCQTLGYNVDTFSGKSKSMEFYNIYSRQSEEERLTNKKNVIVANFVSGSTGLNWQLYSKCILFSVPLLQNYEQGIKRIHRTGQKETCIYHEFTSDNWLEEQMFKTLESGVEYTEDMFEADQKRINELLDAEE